LAFTLSSAACFFSSSAGFAGAASLGSSGLAAAAGLVSSFPSFFSSFAGLSEGLIASPGGVTCASVGFSGLFSSFFSSFFSASFLQSQGFFSSSVYGK